MKIIFSVFVLCFAAFSVQAQWPQFRGPENNMVLHAKNLPLTWGESQNVKWIYAPSGNGWSSPIVWGNKVFLTSAVPLKKMSKTPAPQGPPPPQGPPSAAAKPSSPQPPQDEDTSFRQDIYRWEVICINLDNGKELWKQVAMEGSPRIKTHDGNGYASETPVTDGKYLYAYFGMTGVFCYDLDGTLVWKKDLGAFSTRNGWGTGASPVLFDNRLFIQVDNEQSSFLIALDAATGKEIWKVNRDEKTNYSTPVLWKNKIRNELITSGKTVRAYDPATGKEWWRMTLAGDMSVPSAVYDEEKIYLGNPGGRESKGSLYAVKCGASGDITLPANATTNEYIVWSLPEAPTANPSPLLYQGYLYVLSSRGGEVNCFETSHGSLIYSHKIENVMACWSTPWASKDVIYFYDEKGVTRMFKAGPEFELLPVQNKLDDKFWASVAVAGDAYIIRGAGKLYCIAP